MGKYDKLLLQILRGLSDANIGFDELCGLLKQLDFEMRVRGSHHVFTRNGVREQINLQRDGAKAKPYQMKQMLAVITRYKLGAES
ncbi:MAG TPA: type II toxin-antitoxin system HicA family toxin [Gallionellaceae bacterium]|nr:type II toxin-antitoxin system HicA family toxin [Gallionellaceae bacterium]